MEGMLEARQGPGREGLKDKGLQDGLGPSASGDSSLIIQRTKVRFGVC